MKVRQSGGSARLSSRSAFVAAALVVMTLAGAGIVPMLAASAQIVAEQATETGLGKGLAPASGKPDPDQLRTPSGLVAEGEPVSATRKATAIRRSAPARPAASGGSTAPTGSGWRSARVSWYGPGFYGNTMAGGGTLQPNSMVVAHRSLPFGTRIEFSYKGRTCVAVVQDRGPFVGGRTFDLGPGTAKALGFGGVGTVDYRIL
ncbi:septal ring lytic transglycosylase RlpA family protein [Anaerosoma tenue]|uniref:septal ring lytic transglycosylase RlpA family protein n=1 Tax=Anaerosoma tenue TaxID=2933588 RepID=UPI002260CE4B|nr:septal ring lytic transglycosylase RlpA family protein [Anaerosoma tenue]MCK8115227.1 septal ring lytic transglycosylase RlpA family protein [Anaerosoma tenue]